MRKKSLMLSAAFLASTAITSFAMIPAGFAHTKAAAHKTHKKVVADFPLTLVDDAGHHVTLTKQPHEIASVTEGTDEILSALVPKRDLVLVTTAASNPSYSNIIHFAKGIPAIATANSEQVIAAHPDLALLASYTVPGVVGQIEQTNIPVYEFADFNSIADIERNVKVVGNLVGHEGTAEHVVAKMNQKLQEIHRTTQRAHHKLKVLVYSSYGYAAGSGTTVNDIIADAGGINTTSNLHGWQQITDEEIVKLNPDVIIDSDGDKGFIAKIYSDKGLSSVRAVQNERVYVVRGADLYSASQYIVKGVWDVAHVLYPSMKLPSWQ